MFIAYFESVFLFASLADESEFTANTRKKGECLAMTQDIEQRPSTGPLRYDYGQKHTACTRAIRDRRAVLADVQNESKKAEVPDDNSKSRARACCLIISRLYK